MAFNKEDLREAVVEQFEAEATGWLHNVGTAALDDKGVMGTIFTVLLAIPKAFTGFAARWLAEKIEHSHLGNAVARQGMAGLIRAFADSIDELRRSSGKSDAVIQTEFVARWNQAVAATPGFAFTKSPTPPAAPPDILRTIGAYPAESQDAIFALYGILRKEDTFGVDIVPEVEGDAGFTIISLFESMQKASIETESVLRKHLPGARVHLKNYRNWQMRRIPEAAAASEDEVRSKTIEHSRALVRSLMPFIDALLLAYASRRPTSHAKTQLTSFIDRLNLFAGTDGSPIRQRIDRFWVAFTAGGDAGSKATVHAIAWFGLLVSIGYLFPSATLEFANVTFVALVVATVYYGGGYNKQSAVAPADLLSRAGSLVASGAGGVLGVATAYFVAMLVDTEPVLNNAFPAYQVLFALQPFCLTAAVMCLFFLLVWNQVVLGAIQKACNGAGFLARFIERIVGNETDAKALAKGISESTFITGVGFSILSAASTMVFLSTTLWLLGMNVAERGMILLPCGAAAIVFSNVWASAIRKYPNLAKKHEEATESLANKATGALMTFPPLVIIGLVILGFLGVSRMQSITSHAGAYTSAIADKVDSAVGVEVPTSKTTAAPKAGNAAKCAKLSPASLKAMQAKGVCP